MPRNVPIGPKPGPEHATPPRVPEPSAPPIPGGIPKPARDPDKPKSPEPIPHHGPAEIPLRFCPARPRLVTVRRYAFCRPIRSPGASFEAERRGASSPSATQGSSPEGVGRRAVRSYKRHAKRGRQTRPGSNGGTLGVARRRHECATRYASGGARAPNEAPIPHNPTRRIGVSRAECARALWSSA
jgi:hypothetical protein